eukprot:m.93937 g.93937  ORF g.93937 m.93937 type:complete len:447 (+) comp13421_c0_seq1:203-1543(+)
MGQLKHSFLFFLFSIPCTISVNDVNNSGESSNPMYYKFWCGHKDGLQYLDDALCAKIFPSTPINREFVCPSISSNIPTGYSPEVSGGLSHVNVNTTLLDSIGIPSSVNLALILIRRSAPSEQTQLLETNEKTASVYYKYLGNSRFNEPAETWSSSKIFSITNAARAIQALCKKQSLDSYINGKHGKTILGDLATVICSYDTTAGYTSNSLGKWFGSEVGGSNNLNELVLSWLGNKPRTGDNASEWTESMGGSYGEAPPADLALHKFFQNNESSCTLPSKPQLFYPNTLSPLSAAEWLRRIVLHRSVLPEHKVPNMQWEDAEDIMYGAAPNTSNLFSLPVTMGGMSASTDIFVQSGLNVSTLQSGEFRLLSKLGAGYSTSRDRGEILTNAYTCVPRSNTHPEGSGYVEFILSARASVPLDQSLERAQADLQKAISNVVSGIQSGDII